MPHNQFQNISDVVQQGCLSREGLRYAVTIACNLENTQTTTRSVRHLSSIHKCQFCWMLDGGVLHYKLHTYTAALRHHNYIQQIMCLTTGTNLPRPISRTGRAAGRSRWSTLRAGMPAQHVPLPPHQLQAAAQLLLLQLLHHPPSLVRCPGPPDLIPPPPGLPPAPPMQAR